MKLYYGYKTTCILNNKFYYGVHKSNIFDHKYLGSGKRLQCAIKAHGRENFHKEIVFVFADKDEAYAWEAATVTQDFINLNPSCYNLKPGGSGGCGFGKQSPMYGKRHSEETRKKMSKANSERVHQPCAAETKRKIGAANRISLLGKSPSVETRRKLSKALLGNKRSLGCKLSEETRMRMSKSQKRRRSIENGTKNISVSYL
jgi:group I intron endonuclease